MRKTGLPEFQSYLSIAGIALACGSTGKVCKSV